MLKIFTGDILIGKLTKFAISLRRSIQWQRGGVINYYRRFLYALA